MAPEEQLQIIRQGADVWNDWRKKSPDLLWPDLRKADLSGVNLSGANLRGAKLSASDVRKADLHKARLCFELLRRADLQET